MDGKFYQIETEYFDYDGQQFGMAKAVHEIKKFHGAIKISSLKLYPLKYHDEPEKMTAMLIERGKKFVELAGMQYKYVKGMAFHKVSILYPRLKYEPSSDKAYSVKRKSSKSMSMAVSESHRRFI